MKDWIEGVHYYFNEDGNLVFTEKYHLERGLCCGNGCKHCPFGYVNVPERLRTTRAEKIPLRDKNKK